MPAPVRTKFTSEGAQDVVAAFRSIGEAGKAAAKEIAIANAMILHSQKQVANDNAVNKGTKERVRLSKEEEKAAKQAAAEAIRKSKVEAAALGVERQRVKLEADKVRLQRQQLMLAQAIERAGDRARKKREREEGVRSHTGGHKMSEGRAMRDLFGKNAYFASHGGLGMAVAGSLIFADALKEGVRALHEFSSYIVSDVLMAAMKAKTQAKQLANTGYGEGAFEHMSAFAEAHGTTREKAGAALMSAYGVTRDAGMARQVAGISLQMSKAYGIEDIEGLTNRLGKLRAQLRDLNEGEFSAFADILAAQSKNGGLSAQAMGQLNDQITELASRVAGTDKAGNRATAITGITGIVGMSALHTGDPSRSMAGFAALIADAEKRRVGTDPMGRVKDINAVVGTYMARFGGDERKMHAAGVSDQIIEFLKPFTTIYKTGGEAGVTSAITGAGTGVKAQSGLIAADAAKVQATAAERFSAAVERLKEKFLVLEPSLERLMDLIIANEPQIEKVIDEGLIPLGVAMMDLAGFVVSNIMPIMEMLSGAFELLVGTIKIAILPFTFIPGVLAKFVQMVLALIPDSLKSDGVKAFEKAAGKLAEAFTVGGFEDTIEGLKKIKEGWGKLKADEGAHATTNPLQYDRWRGSHAAAPDTSPPADWSPYIGGAPVGKGHAPASLAAPPLTGLDLLNKKAETAAKALDKLKVPDTSRILPIGSPERMF